MKNEIKTDMVNGIENGVQTYGELQETAAQNQLEIDPTYIPLP